VPKAKEEYSEDGSCGWLAESDLSRAGGMCQGDEGRKRDTTSQGTT